MQIRYGATRLVLLVGDQAIKIGRIRLWKLLGRVVILPFSKKSRGHFLKKYGPGFWHAVWHSLFIGLYANRLE